LILKKRTLAALAVGGAIVVGVGISSTSGSTDTPGHETTAEASPKASASATPSGPATSFTDGTFLVGADIEAGTYKTTGESSDLDLGCYWERASDDSGSMDAIITNNYAQGPGRVTVNSGEVFKTTGDCEWRLVR
jgi:hypothetical protein